MRISGERESPDRRRSDGDRTKEKAIQTGAQKKAEEETISEALVTEEDASGYADGAPLIVLDAGHGGGDRRRNHFLSYRMTKI